jgi:Sec-independent protein secretion pathway component TatC
MCVLYEVGIFLSQFVQRRKAGTAEGAPGA